jgi:hypothetical protein
VAAATSPPLTAGPPSTVNLTSIDSTSAPRISTQDVTAGFFGALEIPIVAGRAFDERDIARGVPAVVLNARAAGDLFGSPALAVGQRLRLDDEGWREVVGVSGNVRTTFFNTLEWRTDPIVYRPAQQGLARLGDPTSTSFTLFVQIRAARPLLASEVREAVRQAGSSAAVIELERVPDMVSVATKQPTLRMTLLLWLCAVSLLLAAIGVYGIVTQAVQERRREIAIRVALGAQPRAVMAGLVRRALTDGVAGLAAGVVLALLLGRALESLLYGVRTGDAVSIAMATAVLLTVTGLAAWAPAFRATRGDTTHALRGD